jgi:hypothetical protein
MRRAFITVMTLIARLPAPVRKVPYAVVLMGSKISLKAIFPRLRPQVWAKNSFATGALIPGVSDLDLVLWLKKRPKEKTVKRLSGVRKWLKLSVPFMGEWTVLDKSMAQELQGSMNLFEWLRDPGLSKHLDRPTPTPLALKAQGLVFYLRMLEADKENLKSRAEIRVLKWTHHRKMLRRELGLPFKGEVSLMNLAEEVSRFFFEKEERTKFKRTLLAFLVAQPEELPKKDWIHSKEFLLVSSPVWLAMALHHHKFESLLRELNKLTEYECEIVRAHLQWEVWGLSHQWIWIESKRNLWQHLANLKRLAQALPHRYHALEEQLESLLSEQH